MATVKHNHYWVDARGLRAMMELREKYNLRCPECGSDNVDFIYTTTIGGTASDYECRHYCNGDLDKRKFFVADSFDAAAQGFKEKYQSI